MRNALAILWPSFLFALLDPVDLRFVGPLEFGRKSGYTIGFFFFWARRRLELAHQPPYP